MMHCVKALNIEA